MELYEEVALEFLALLPELDSDLLLAGDAHAHRLVSSSTVLLVDCVRRH